MRYLPLNDEDRADMLARIGVSNIDALFADIPKAKRLEQDLDLPSRKTEMEVERVPLGLRQKMSRRARCRFLWEPEPTSIMFQQPSII